MKIRIPKKQVVETEEEPEIQIPQAQQADAGKKRVTRVIPQPQNDALPEIDVEISGGRIHFSMPLESPAQASKSGKSILVASTHGIKKTGAQWKNRQLQVVFNAFVDVRE